MPEGLADLLSARSLAPHAVGGDSPAPLAPRELKVGSRKLKNPRGRGILSPTDGRDRRSGGSASPKGFGSYVRDGQSAKRRKVDSRTDVCRLCCSRALSHSRPRFVLSGRIADPTRFPFPSCLSWSFVFFVLRLLTLGICVICAICG